MIQPVQFRARTRTPKFLNRVEVVEINAKSKDGKKVRFVDRQNVIDSNVKVLAVSFKMPVKLITVRGPELSVKEERIIKN